MILQLDSFEFLRTKPDYYADLIYADPPYGLGSEIIIRPDGKPDYLNASDFMNSWDMPTGDYWEKWFKEAFRVLKYGGYCILFGMDRQLMLFKYYAMFAGFKERQSLYWYYISNFPKACDLSKNIDKYFGEEREVVKEIKTIEGDLFNKKQQIEVNKIKNGDRDNDDIRNITAPATPLAKKYEGYKYSITPLKQCNETIMIFQKPYKTGSCLYDTLAYENGDTECLCGALNIDGNKVGTGTGKVKIINHPNITAAGYNQGKHRYKEFGRVGYQTIDNGRYPAQTFLTGDGTLDKQYFKILQKCEYEEEPNLYFYCHKVSTAEREAGLEKLENGIKKAELSFITDLELKNPHPTLKPIKLNEQILKLFKTPNPQKILYPFAGAGSEIIGGIRAGFKDWEACEINEDYIKIAEERIKYWSERIERRLFDDN